MSRTIASYTSAVAIAIFFSLLSAGCAATKNDRDLNRGWHFLRDDVPAAREQKFDDRAWQSVNLPHAWNNLDGQDGGNDYYRGACWYRRRVTVPSADRGRRFFLRFDGAATVTDVFVNGTPVGTHRGNFGAFCFDVTEQLHPGRDDNVVAVRVDNSKLSDVAPLSGDFTIFGGLYRDVRLLVRDPLCVWPLDDASNGVYITTARADAESADVVVTTKVMNARDKGCAAAVRCTVLDTGGRAVATATSNCSVESRSVADAITRVSIPRPHFWDGRRDPYFYRVTVEVMRGDGRVTDGVTQPLGLRAFSIDPARGFFLNGRPYPLHGVNRHQDRINKGWAIGRAEHDQDFSLIQELGCTAVRLSHYQHADYFYSLCDRGGVLAWAELPLVNDIAHTPEFAANARQQLRELIKQNYNHPSIFCWSLYNELALRGPEFDDERRLITELRDLAHALDATRPTVAATHKQQIEHPVNWIPDITAFNRYYGWYQGSPDEWPAALDKLHATFPDRRIGISEYGAGASIYQHELHPTTRPRTAGPFHPEEWQCIVHEAAWSAMKDRPWLWCSFIWCMFDFAADQRHEGDHPGRNDKGLVTYDRKTKKDAFYFYKANWSDEPVVHITESRYTPRPIGPVDVKVYSNCDQVELRLDGRSQGVAGGSDVHVFQWRGVRLDAGRHQLRAIGTRRGRQFVDECRLEASPAATTRLATPPDSAQEP